MNHQLLREVYSKNPMTIAKYHQVESATSQPSRVDVLERSLKIKEHVEREFSTELKRVSVHLSHEQASVHNTFCVRHTLSGSTEKYEIHATD